MPNEDPPIGQIILPQGPNGGGFVTVYSNGDRSGAFSVLKPRHVKILLLLNESYVKDRNRGVPPETSGCRSYDWFVRMIKERFPLVLGPDRPAIVAYMFQLGRIFKRILTGDEELPLQRRRGLGARLRGRFEILDQSQFST